MIAFFFSGTQEPNLTLHFDQEPQNVVAVRGKPLVLQCAASSSAPGPVNISWTQEDEPLVLVNDSRRHILRNGSLYFKKVSAFICGLEAIHKLRHTNFMIFYPSPVLVSGVHISETTPPT